MDINSVLVVGTGTMGTGISQFLAESGVEVYLYDISEIQLAKGYLSITERLEKQVKKKELTPTELERISGRIHLLNNLSDACAFGMLVETVTEKIEIKKQVLGELSRLVSNETIIATNTSSLSVSEMARAVTLPERFLGLHFFSPVSRMHLIEVIPSPCTTQAVIEQAVNFLQLLGKKCLIVNESPGFIVNRLLITMINEACYLLSEGVGKAEDIDEAMKLGGGLVIGPLALGDFIGLDVCLDILDNYHREFGEAKYRPCPLLRKMVRAGYLGRKTGKGFFVYPT
ncbi:3-hydroxybutyryl-CoA dehydrogenase [Paradesulfitobacterium aromaticivorans]